MFRSASASIRAFCLGALTSAVLAASQGAHAASDFDRASALLKACTIDSNANEAKVKACSDLIAGIRAGDPGAREFADYLTDAIKFRGLTYFDMKDYVHAMADLNELVTRFPKESYYYAKRSEVYEAKGDLARAITDYDMVVRLDPTLGSSFTHRARLYLAKGDFDRAMADYAEAIKAGGDKYAPLYLVERAEVYRSKGQFDRAIADCDQAIRLDSKEAAAYRLRGAAKKAKGDAFGGDADIAKADEITVGLHQDIKNIDDAFKACSDLMMAAVDGFRIKNLATLVKQCNADHDPNKATCNDMREQAAKATALTGVKVPSAWTCR
jgi:tetratricopeptide (TPR) repeat protein